MRRTVRRFGFPGIPLRMAGWIRPLLGAAVGISLAIACGQEVSIPDPVIDPVDASTNEGGTDAAANTDATIQDGGADAADVVCPEVAPDDALGVYVSPGGINNDTCGTISAPCKTISTGITRARAVVRSKVYASRGVYVEHLTLAAGIEIVGGWDVTSATTWKRACVSPEDAVVVRAPAAKNITVEATDLGGEARLSLLRIESKLQAQVDGDESLYGVAAMGATTTVVMNDVRIEMANAGTGTNGIKGDAGVDGGPGCPTGTGVVGTAGTQGPGAPVGTFDTTGYSPGAASPGGAAGPGDNGTVAGTATCVKCGSCALALPPLCDGFAANGTESCAKDGTSGCGGGSGAPGGAALGGGSNVGVFAWGATVTINGGKIKSGDAGDGGTGGGVAGTNGDLCTTGCALDGMANLCKAVTSRGIGGTAGGAGGAGGVGGPGGGGGGGSSFAIYASGSGIVTTTPSTSLAHGKAGKGGGPDAGAGPSGIAADRVP